MPAKRKIGGAKLNKRQIRQVKRITGTLAENKVIEDEVIGNISATGSTQQLTNPSQGVGATQRVGDRITLKRIEMRFNAIGADASNLLRVIIWRWTQDNAAGLPNANNLLATGPSTVTYGVNSPYKWSALRSGEIHIVYDKTFVLPETGTKQIYVSKTLFGRRLGKKYIEYNPGATTGADQFYITVLSDSTASSHPEFNYWQRLVYEDS